MPWPGLHVCGRVAAGCLLTSLLAAAAPAHGQGAIVHGADSVFATADAVIVWGILRAPVEADTEVVIRIAAPAFAAVSLEAVDPFGTGRRMLVPPRPLVQSFDARRRRTDFADLPRLQVRLHREPSGPPSLTVYYLGVPDTTPEFTTEATLVRYLAETLARARASVMPRPR